MTYSYQTLSAQHLAANLREPPADAYHGTRRQLQQLFKEFQFYLEAVEQTSELEMAELALQRYTEICDLSIEFDDKHAHEITLRADEMLPNHWVFWHQTLQEWEDHNYTITLNS